MRSPPLPTSSVAQGVVIAFAVLVGGCSADVTRFDFPFFGLTDKGGETGSLPTPPESMARRNPSYDDGPSAPAARRRPGRCRPGLHAGALLASTPYAATPRPYTGSADRVANARDYAPPPPAADPAPGADRYAGRPMDRPRAAARGETIQVQQGDTLYGISKRYGVSISALIEVNGLAHGSTIKPGQQLVLPAGVTPPSPRRSSPPAARRWRGRRPRRRRPPHRWRPPAGRDATR